MTTVDVAPYLPLAAALATVSGVVLTLRVTGRRQREDRERDDRRRAEDSARRDTERSDEQKRSHEATAGQMAGAARVVRNRLSIISQTGGLPVEGLIAFDRLVRLAYEARSAALVASSETLSGFYDDVGRFEQAVEAMRYCLNRIREIAPPGTNYSPELRARVEELRDSAIAAANEAASIIDRLRNALGDRSVVDEVSFSLDDLAPSVARERIAQRTSEQQPTEPPS